MFIDIDADAAREPEIVERGEYEVQVTRVDEEMRTSRNGNEYITMQISIVGVPYAQEIYHNMFMPSSNLEERVNNKRLLTWKALFDAFDLEKSGEGYNLQELVGRTGRALIGEDTDQNDIPRNRVMRFLPTR